MQQCKIVIEPYSKTIHIALLMNSYKEGSDAAPYNSPEDKRELHVEMRVDKVVVECAIELIPRPIPSHLIYLPANNHLLNCSLQCSDIIQSRLVTWQTRSRILVCSPRHVTGKNKPSSGYQE